MKEESSLGKRLMGEKSALARQCTAAESLKEITLNSHRI